MNKPLKASLLSFFIFPGLGHFFLRKYLHGVILTGVATTGLYIVVTKAIDRAYQVLEQIQHEGLGMDVATITELALKQPEGADGNLLDIAMAAVVISWVIGFIDSYRVAYNLDKNPKSEK